MIRKEAFVSDAVMAQLKAIVDSSEIMQYDDSKWPEPTTQSKQEIEIVHNNEHISFSTTKIGSLLDVQSSDDPDGLRALFYLTQDLKCLVFALMSLHFKIKPLG
mmetsp:Transcript_24808/g.60379  ORF Transcript_24808/g.60379 Transcript_24808/m.60379 type:complete len:104 (+) Transcript_24808:176-487(+)